ncbi:hypothetical protein D1610_11515 [Sphingomonas gilva]|uniref:Uncharacterized protein n=1 Tax=Sphingomonas gilva TaxID=2305907 RepID=A0A396RLH9_9SPHN|nr:hypothetical protein [Sphingomonas gilva]RHW17170.1 hypothetical protein D1610_11515 [Sphingomonas gilva]
MTDARHPAPRIRVGAPGAAIAPITSRLGDIEKVCSAITWLRSHGVSVSSAGDGRWWVSGGFAAPFAGVDLVALARRKGFDGGRDRGDQPALLGVGQRGSNPPLSTTLSGEEHFREE